MMRPPRAPIQMQRDPALGMILAETTSRSMISLQYSPHFIALG